jgi:hypothetical protein
MVTVCDKCSLWKDKICHNICNMAMVEVRDFKGNPYPAPDLYLTQKEYEYRNYAERFTCGQKNKVDHYTTTGMWY